MIETLEQNPLNFVCSPDAS